MRWANEIIQKIKAKGYWADAADPCSGMPVYSRSGPATFDDVSAHNRLLRYNVHTVGGASGIPCKVVSFMKGGGEGRREGVRKMIEITLACQFTAQRPAVFDDVSAHIRLHSPSFCFVLDYFVCLFLYHNDLLRFLTQNGDPIPTLLLYLP